MANPLTRAFLQEVRDRVALPDPIVEFGALQVEHEQEGDLRPLFAGRPYLGTDFRAGPGVDRVEDLRALTFADGEVGTAICLDTLEHCADPPLALRELARVTAPGGVCVISSVLLFGIHGYPQDFFRFTPEGFRAMLEQGFDQTWVGAVGHPDMPVWILGIGSHGVPLPPDGAGAFPSLARAQADFDAAEGHVKVGVVNHRPRDLAGALARALPRLARERLGRGRS
ncbi:MAG TPA: methyltransferase domain-containing protein [Baekduia sp.]|nr:methyltransferase domain-containing protein [Baekduia sp.]